jgi:hypothetical protein
VRDAQPDGPTTDRLRAVLQAGLDALPQPPGAITSIARRASRYRSSYPLEELTVGLANGTHLELMFKNLNRASLTPDAREAKPREMYDPHREIEVYRSILSDAAIGTARCYVAVADDTAGDYWLCMETAPGVELYQVGELATWQSVAVWLADFHARFAHDNRWRTGAAGRHLATIDRRLMQTWLDRARVFAAERHDAAATAALTALDARWEEVVDTLMSWPRTLVHGEFYASNVLVDDGRTPVRVCPIDWEMAADGPGIIDLAALTAGTWKHDEPDRIVDAYLRAAVQIDDTWTRPVFDHALACARVYIAVQWLGWARDWTPPSEHSHDWARALTRLVGGLHA